MSVKDANYLGAAGEEAACTEFLRRGYNVAYFLIDEGIDLVVSDSTKDLLYGVQVKTSEPTTSGAQLVGHYLLSREQLAEPKRNELFYVFVLSKAEGFVFVVVSQRELFHLRLRFEQTSKRSAKTEELNLRLFFAPSGEISGWGQPFSSFLGFERYFPFRSHSAR